MYNPYNPKGSRYGRQGYECCTVFVPPDRHFEQHREGGLCAVSDASSIVLDEFFDVDLLADFRREGRACLPIRSEGSCFHPSTLVGVLLLSPAFLHPPLPFLLFLLRFLFPFVVLLLFLELFLSFHSLFPFLLPLFPGEGFLSSHFRLAAWAIVLEVTVVLLAV